MIIAWAWLSGERREELFAFCRRTMAYLVVGRGSVRYQNYTVSDYHLQVICSSYVSFMNNMLS